MSVVYNLSRRMSFAIAAVTMLTIAAAPIAPAAEADLPASLPVDMFDAMEAGQIDVKFIPKDSTKANVLIQNLTEQPLEIKLPDAFAGVPILSQMGMGMGGGGMGGMGGGGMGGMGGGGGGQGMGGGMGGMGGGGMGMGGGGMGGMGGGFMRVAPERMRKLAVTTVCLEHGKPEPNPKMAYKIVPLEEFTGNAEVRVVCEALGHGQITQKTAQAAAWNMMDGLTWQELAAKNRVESKYTGNIRWFSPIELRTAMAVVREASRVVEMRSKNGSGDSNEYGDSDSSGDSGDYESDSSSASANG